MYFSRTHDSIRTSSTIGKDSQIFVSCLMSKEHPSNVKVNSEDTTRRMLSRIGAKLRLLLMSRYHNIPQPQSIAAMNCFSFDPKRQTSEVLSLCLAGITHSFLLFSFFPYSGYMAVTLLKEKYKVDVNNVGVYAGMLGSAFTLGRCLGFLPWKVVRKSLGEKYALVLSLGLTGLASLWVGLCTNFSGALLARLVQGLSNCVSGSVKRAAVNARHNRNHEMMLRTNSSESSLTHDVVYDANPEALVLAVMWWGTAIGPIIGGLLSDPGFLGIVFRWKDSPFAWYQTHPYLLSNGFSAILCWISMISVAITSQHLPPKNVGLNKEGEFRSLLTPPSTKGYDDAPIMIESKRLWDFFRTLWKTNQDAKKHLVAYWAFSFVTVCIDEALPLFVITSIDSTGLGLSEGRVGLLLSASGFLVALSHHAALDNFINTGNGSKDGMYRVLSTCAFLANLPVVLVPLSLILNSCGNRNTLLGLTPWSFLYLVLIFALLRGSGAIFFDIIGIKTGRTLKVDHKNEVARIMTMGALLVRSISPIVAGALVSYFMAPLTPSRKVTSPLFSSWMVWVVIGLGFGQVTGILTILLSRMPQREWITEKQQVYRADRLDGMSSMTDSKEEIHEKHPPTWKDHIVAPGVDFDRVSFFIIGTHKNDKRCSPHVLTPPIMETLQKHMPTNCSESNFWLKYSLLRDGASMHSLEARSGVSRNTILAVETLKGDVFGCFMTTVSILQCFTWIFFATVMLTVSHYLIERGSNENTSPRFQQTTHIEDPANHFFGA